jgi:MFS family permease
MAAEGAIDVKRDRLVITASSLGTVFEWYDFFVYGILAATIGKLFFPADNPALSTLASLVAFGVGFGVRPLGAILFGYFGDKIGRKYTFLVTITLMGGATAAIGFLPTSMFARVGAWRRIWWCGNLCCRACTAGKARAIYQLDSSVSGGRFFARGIGCVDNADDCQRPC